MKSLQAQQAVNGSVCGRTQSVARVGVLAAKPLLRAKPAVVSSLHHKAQPAVLLRPSAVLPARPARRSVTVASTGAAAAPAPKEDKKPVYDFPKLLGLGIIFLGSTFNYTILQNLKDSIVVTAAGAEALPFLEAYGVLPGSLMFFTFYSWLNRTLPEKVVYPLALAPFIAFYSLFATVLYPLAPKLHPYHLLESWRAMLPGGLVGLAGMAVNYLYSIFFCFAELWGGVAISVLFWGLANNVCSMDEAKNVYSLLGILANVGLIVAGAWIKFVNGTLAHGNALLALRYQVGTIVAVAGVMVATKAFIDNYMAGKEVIKGPKKEKKKKSDKGLGDSLDVVKKSPKIMNLAVLVVSYFVTQKLFDFAWKAQLKVFYPSPVAYQQALATVSQLTGMATIVLMATSKFVFKYLGWGGAAIVTPLAILVTGSLFFGAAIASRMAPGTIPPALLAAAVSVGAMSGVIGRVASKSAKYSLFDPAKEMVYITMSKEEKTEGKAAVDLLASYGGKSGASWITQACVLLLGTLSNAMPLLGLVHVIICSAWTGSTLKLAAMMRKEEEEAEAAKKAAAEAPAPAEESAPVSATTTTN